MDPKTFAKLVAATQAVIGKEVTAVGRRDAFAPLAKKLTPREKIDGARAFARNLDSLKKLNLGSWYPWFFVDGVAGGNQKLPWTREDIDDILAIIIEESHALPPPFVARACKHFIAEHGVDASLKKTLLRAALSLWPRGATEGANFKKAAADLRALAATR